MANTLVSGTMGAADIGKKLGDKLRSEDSVFGRWRGGVLVICHMIFCSLNLTNAEDVKLFMSDNNHIVGASKSTKAVPYLERYALFVTQRSH